MQRQFLYIVVIAGFFSIFLSGSAQETLGADPQEPNTEERMTENCCEGQAADREDQHERGMHGKRKGRNRGQSGVESHPRGQGGMGMSRDRHHYVRDNGLPVDYQSVKNALESSSANVAAGKSLYESECAMCHGADGSGNGEAGANLDPAPTNIARFAQMRMATDDYLFWTLAEGGQPIDSDMPAFKEKLLVDQRWQIILYLRQLGERNL